MILSGRDEVELLAARILGRLSCGSGVGFGGWDLEFHFDPAEAFEALEGFEKLVDMLAESHPDVSLCIFTNRDDPDA